VEGPFQTGRDHGDEHDHLASEFGAVLIESAQRRIYRTVFHAARVTGECSPPVMYLIAYVMLRQRWFIRM
jgi:hypothetical protein